MLQSLFLVALLLQFERAGQFNAAPALHDVVVLDQIPDHTQSVVDAPHGFLHDDFVCAADHNGHGFAVLALRNLDHFV